METLSRLLDVAIYALFIYIGYMLAGRKQAVKPQEKQFTPLPSVPAQDAKENKKESKEEINSFFN